MLDPLDDYPIHQTALPLAHPVASDPNTFDRFFFNGFDRAATIYFGAAMGLYPVRDIIDASFSVVHDGVQRSLHASGRMPRHRSETRIGPLQIEIVDPMRTLRVIVDAPELGIAADLTFDALALPFEEPRHATGTGAVTLLDSSRLTQWGSWTGTIDVDGTSHRVDAATHVGVRDRSWGIRPVGAPAPAAPGRTLPEFFWWWAPTLFDDEIVHAACNEHGDGRRWYGYGFTMARPQAADATVVDDPYDPAQRELLRVEHAIDWVPGTRRAARATITATRPDGEVVVIELEPQLCFPLLGLGYHHPEWAHGNWHDELAVGTESWKVAALDPLDVGSLHVQQLVHARHGDRTGIGVFEQLVIGAHRPSGFREFLDGAG